MRSSVPSRDTPGRIAHGRREHGAVLLLPTARRRLGRLDAAPPAPPGDSMTRTSRRNGLALAALGPVLVTLAAACNGGGTSTTSPSALASTIASATASTGTLLCSPAQAQVDSCSGLAAGDACTLSTADGGSTTSGTCRTTIDGGTGAGAPTPPS